MLKVDLHCHSGEDAVDKDFKHDARMLIDKAAELKFDVLAITNHETVTYTPTLATYARKRGILLIPSCEATIEGKHTLLYNVTEKERQAINTFDDLRALRRKRGKSLLVIAPHPFYPSRNSGRNKFVANKDLFDAIEISQFYHARLNYNKKAIRFANEHKMPLVATSDAHSFRFFGRVYTHVNSMPTVLGIIEAIRAGKVDVVSAPLPTKDFLYIFRNGAMNWVRKYTGFNPHRAF